MTPAAVYVLAAVRAVIVGDWSLARWAHRRAVLARVSVLLDDGHEIEIPSLVSAHELRRRSDADERLPVTTTFVR